MMTAKEREEHERQRVITLWFGRLDMEDVIHTAVYLRDADPQALQLEVRRTLEAGMFVAYARPFTRSRGRPQLHLRKGRSPEHRELHREFLERRDKLYAHSDEIQVRKLESIL